MLPRNIISFLGGGGGILFLRLPSIALSVQRTLLRFFDVDVYPLVIRVGFDKATDPAFEVIKFEKDYKNTLMYKFVDAFPLAISTMPLSYDASSLIKCQVSFNYVRYIVNPLPVPSSSGSQSQATPALNKQLTDLFSPDAQAAFNADAFTNAPDLGLNITPKFTPDTNLFENADNFDAASFF